MIKGVLTAILFVFSSFTGARAAGVCASFSGTQSTQADRVKLLELTKSAMQYRASLAALGLEVTRSKVVNCSEIRAQCESTQGRFLTTLMAQLRVFKLLTILTKSDYLYRVPLLRVDYEFRNGRLKAQEVLDFSLDGFTFSSQDQQVGLMLWRKVYDRLSPRHELQKSTGEVSGALAREMRTFFNIALLELISANPLLPFLNERALESKRDLLAAFDQLIDFNQKFLKSVEDLEVNHQTGLWSYLNLTVNDHEMGLLNFGELIQQVIKQSPQDEHERLCNAWNYMQSQQQTRVRTSIGVGFGAAVVCGVGVWSGIGAVPAAGFCSLAVADALWGAYVGKMHALLGRYAMYAGKSLDTSNLNFSGEVMSIMEANHMQSTGDAVFMINALGLIPIANSVLKTVKGARGSLSSLMVVPSSDVATSFTEGGTTYLLYIILAIRGFELQTDNLTDILRTILWEEQGLFIP